MGAFDHDGNLASVAGAEEFFLLVEHVEGAGYILDLARLQEGGPLRDQARDLKGIYRRGAAGTAQDVPGVSAPYEPPMAPVVVDDGEKDDPAAAARRIMSALEKKGYLPRGPGDATGAGQPF